MRGRKKIFFVFMVKDNITNTSEVKIKTVGDIIKFIKEKDYKEFNFVRKKTGKIEYTVKKLNDNEIKINEIPMKLDDNRIIIDKNEKRYIFTDVFNKQIDEFIKLIQEEILC